MSNGSCCKYPSGAETVSPALANLGTIKLLPIGPPSILFTGVGANSVVVVFTSVSNSFPDYNPISLFVKKRF